MRLRILFSLLSTAFMTSCTPEAKAIAYGFDACHYCRMTIVDQKHAAQLVTKKAKVFSFDAIECMLNHLEEIDKSSVALYLVSDFTQPGNLTDATEATFLISANIPSPMGANLSAFKVYEAGKAVRDVHGGNVYSWQELLIHQTH